MTMKVLFLHPPWPGEGFGLRSQNRWPRKRGDKTNRYPILLCTCATYVRDQGHEVSYIDSVIQNYDLNKTILKIKELKPDIIFIESATPTFSYDKLVIDKLKSEFPVTKVIVAGYHVTTFPVQSMESSKIDIIIKGEMDQTTVNVIEALSKDAALDDIKGICFRKNGKIVNNPDAELIKNLDSLPFADRDLIPHSWYTEGYVTDKPFTFIMGSRGCPQRCAYCLWPTVYFKNRLRLRSIKNIVDEIEWLIKKYGMKEIFFDDDTLNVTTSRVKELSNEIIKRGIKIKWSCSMRMDNVDEEMLRLAKKSGCKLICYGAESSSQETLDRINKNLKVEQIIKTVKLTKKAKILAHLNFMIGFPWETREDIEDCINFAIKLDPDSVQFSLCYPHPGSPMYFDAVKNKLFYEDVLGNWEKFGVMTEPLLKTKVGKEYLLNAVSKAHAKFYLRPSYFFKQVKSIKSFSDLKRIVRGFNAVLFGKILFRRRKK
ncbi:radical SAM protein [Candidatus Woesearchaeota archaeon]|nr:MAG: radical SAM protein [Candidatus Woesearchaeota archaeon]